MGGDTSIDKPQAPETPTVSSGIGDYIENYPRLFELQQKYSPQEAQLQLELAQQYALPMGQAMQSAQEGLYPQTAGLQEQLAGQASEGMQGQMPDWMRQQYLDELRANTGSNVGSPIGADYVSRGMLNQNEQYRNYYQNLGLSVTGRQPLAQGATPQTNNISAGFTPNQALGFNQGVYGTQASLYNNQNALYAQQQQSNANLPFKYIAGAGNLMQGMGSMFNPVG